MKWKKFSLLILAAVPGSAMTIGTYLVLVVVGKTIKTEHLAGPPVVGATYTLNPEGEIVPLEFTDVAKKVTPAVVHIKSIQRAIL